MTNEISIGQVKRDISELVNRVAYKGERIVLTSRGRPKAALVSLEDYQKLQQLDTGQSSRSEWLAKANELAEQIQKRRGGTLIDVDELLRVDREDLEGRNAR